MSVPDGSVRGPLSGVRVVDLTRVVMGPFATQVLADQGADVIMVEAAEGDGNRVMGPGPHREFSGLALNLLRNKRSVRADLKSDEGIDFVSQLIAESDVFVSTIRPSALQRLGLDYTSVAAIRPDIVYCQAQGFALGSARQDDPAYDDIIQAATGVADMVQRVWGEPALLPTIFADKVCGMVMAQAIVSALYYRERTGIGQHVEVPMQQAMSAFMLAEHGSGAISEPPQSQEGRPAVGYPRVLSKERRPHATKDGFVHLFPYLPKHWVRLFSDAGVPGADTDPRYVDARSSLVHSDSLYRDVRKLSPSRTTQEWLDYCREVGIPATEVPSLQDLVDELPLVEHPVTGKYRLIPQMSNFSETPGGLRYPAPSIGEHTEDVEAELARGAESSAKSSAFIPGGGK